MDKSRIDKIKILAALHDGVIAPEDIRQDHRYRFQEVGPGVFEYEGKKFNEVEMDAFFKNAHERREKTRVLLGQDIDDSVIGFVFRIPDNIPEVTKPVQQVPIVPPLHSTTVYLDELYAPAEVTNQEAAGEAIKPVIVDQEEKDTEPTNKPILFRNITNQFLY